MTNKKSTFQKVISFCIQVAELIFSLLKHFFISLLNLIRFIFSHLIGCFILTARWHHPAKNKDLNGFETENRENFEYQSKGKTERVYKKNTREAIKTSDGVTLELFSYKDTKDEASQSDSSHKDKDQKYIIIFGGSGSTGESGLRTAYELSKVDPAFKNATFISFSHRGIAGSQNKIAGSSQDLINDGIAVVQHILEKGIPPKNILLYSHSIGGAIATFTAKHFHKNDQKVFLFSDRSFLSMTHFIIGILLKNIDILLYYLLKIILSPITFIYNQVIKPKEAANVNVIFKPIRKVFYYAAYVLYPPIKTLLILTGWTLDAGTAFKDIPIEYRAYQRIYSKDIPNPDPIVTDYAAIAKMLKQERKEIKNHIRQDSQLSKDGKTKQLETIKKYNRDAKIELEKGQGYKQHVYPLEILMLKNMNNQNKTPVYTHLLNFFKSMDNTIHQEKESFLTPGSLA